MDLPVRNWSADLIYRWIFHVADRSADQLIFVQMDLARGVQVSGSADLQMDLTGGGQVSGFPPAKKYYKICLKGTVA